MKTSRPPASKTASDRPARKPAAGQKRKVAPPPASPPPRAAPKSSFDLAMERLRAADRESGTTVASLSPKQKEEIAEARRVASSRLAEREILFRDSMRNTPDPAEREKAEGEYQIDRQRINDDCERAIEAIRRRAG